MITKPYTIQQKGSILNEFKNSKESMSTFTKRKHMSPSTLRKWLREENSENDNLKRENFGIVHLNVNEEDSNENAESEEIYFKCDRIELRLKKGYKLILLQKIFEVLAYVK